MGLQLWMNTREGRAVVLWEEWEEMSLRTMEEDRMPNHPYTALAWAHDRVGVE